MSARSLKIKAVLQREEDEGLNPEIRRLTVEWNDRDDVYQRLQSALRSVFNVQSSQGSCNLFWKDDDGDMIRFSTSDELGYAIDNMSDDVFRVYVTLAQDDSGEGTVPIIELNDDDEDTGEPCPRRVTFTTPLGGRPPFYRPYPFQGDGFQPQRRAWAAWWKRSGPYPWAGPFKMWAGRKGKKMARKWGRIQRRFAADDQKKLQEARREVPGEFRSWVRDYVRAWFSGGPQHAAQGARALPGGVPPSFPAWLHRFLQHWSQRQGGQEEQGEMEQEGEKEEGEMLARLEGLPEVYYTWLCVFLPVFYQRQILQQNDAGFANQEGDFCCAGGQGPCHGDWHPQGRWGHGHGWQGKRGRHCRKGKKKHGGHSSSSDSEDSDMSQEKCQRVPKPLRKYVRRTVKQQRKGKTDLHPKAQHKALRAGLTPDLLDFVQQVLLEFRAKLAHQRPQEVAQGMMQGDRTLPAGMERGHFLWLCAFLARWYRRHAGKCDAASAYCSSSESSESGEEGEEKEGGCCQEGCRNGCNKPCQDGSRNWGGWRNLFGWIPGMMGDRGHHYGNHNFGRGMQPDMMGGACPGGHAWMAPPPPPPPPHHHMPPPPPFPGCWEDMGHPQFPPLYPTLPETGRPCRHTGGQPATAPAEKAHEEKMEQVTEGVKKM